MSAGLAERHEELSAARAESAAMPLAQKATYLCVATILWVTSFGNLQPSILPPILESGLFLTACLGIAFLVLYTGRVYATSVGVLFMLGLTSELLLQAFLAVEDFGAVAAKTLATGLLFVLFSATPFLTPASLVKIVRYGASLHVVASLIVVASTSVGIRPDVGTGRLSWVGWFDQKNYLGLAAAIACATLAAQVLAERRIRATTAVLLGVSAVALSMAHSRGALLWLAAFALCYASAALGFHLRMVVHGLLALSVAILAAILFAPPDLLQLLGGITTGRTVLWEQARAYFEASPWVGQGMGASYRETAAYFDLYGNIYRGAHNGFLAILIDAGVIGLAIYIGMIALTANAVARQSSQEAATLLCMIGAFLLYNCVESALDKTTNISFVLFPLALAAAMGGLAPTPSESTSATGPKLPTGVLHR